jgi:hypothetical protein
MVVFVTGCNDGTSPTVQSGPGQAVNNTAGSPMPVTPMPLVISQAVAPVVSSPADTESITLEFVEVLSNAKGDFVVLRFTNTTDKTIQGILGSVRAYDDAGSVVRGYGYTDQVFNKQPGESVDIPLLKIRLDGPFAPYRARFHELNFVYEARDITFAE